MMWCRKEIRWLWQPGGGNWDMLRVGTDEKKLSDYAKYVQTWMCG